MPKINRQDTTKLHELINYNVKDMKFDSPVENSIPNSSIKYQALPIYTNNRNDKGELDETEGECVLLLPRLFSFGISDPSELKKDKSLEDSGGKHSLPLSFWGKNSGPSEQGKALVDKIKEIVQHVKSYLLENKSQIKRPKLVEAHLDCMDKILFVKTDDNGNVDPNVSPIFSPKMLEKFDKNTKTRKIITPIVDDKGNDVDPITLISKKNDKHFFETEVAVLFEYVYISSDKYYIQAKVYEAIVYQKQQEKKPLLRRRFDVSSISDDLLLGNEEKNEPEN